MTREEHGLEVTIEELKEHYERNYLNKEIFGELIQLWHDELTKKEALVVSCEAGDAVTIKTKKDGILIAETLIRIDEYSFDCKKKTSKVTITASDANPNGFIPIETKYKLQ